MGFLDKLNNLLQATLSNQAPLTDPTERKYYEIAFNVLRLIHAGSYQVIKKYAGFTLGIRPSFLYMNLQAAMTQYHWIPAVAQSPPII